MLGGLSKFDEAKMLVLAMMCWWIWNKRCKWLFKGEVLDAGGTMCLVIVPVDEF